MDWIVRTLLLPPPLAPFIEERLVAAGWERLSCERSADSRSLRLRIFVRPGEVLPSPEGVAEWIAEAEASGLPATRLRFEDEELEERDWSAGFRERFAPRELAPGLAVLPPWDRTGPVHRLGDACPGPSAELSLVIEPAQAFGTGDHPTTVMCLQLLRDYSRAREKSGAGPFDCLDIGSGTGILTLAAKLWGARRAEGFDIDKRSILNAYLNADLNGLAGHVRFRWGEPAGLGLRRWDIIVCNLFLTPILKYLPRMDRCLRPGGVIILSGFLHDQKDRIASAAKSRNWRMRVRRARDGWLAEHWMKAPCRADSPPERGPATRLPSGREP